MTRRSAVPLNLSPDMLDETVQQANKVFSLPLVPSNTPGMVQPTKNEQIIILPEMDNALICPDTGKSLKHSKLITLLHYKIRWMRSTASEIGRLEQGIKCGVKGTNTIKFISREDIPVGRKATYGSFVVDIKTHREETECTRLTVGGDQVECPGDADSNWIGITKIDLLIYPCRATSRQHYTNSNIQHQHALKMHHTHGARLYMAPKHNTWRSTNTALCFLKRMSHIQQLAGTLLYYARALYPTLILPVNVLASEQTQATAATSDKVIKLLNYCATHLEAKLRYHASGMILNMHSDASYLSEREAKNRAGGFFYMGSNIDSKNKLTNRAILIISTILKHVMSSEAEA
jgi:hypothetical protein